MKLAKESFLMCLSFIVSLNVFGQQIESNSLVILENQKNQDIVEINQLWKNYLMSSPDSLYNNPYWNKADKERYKSYDLLRSEGYMRLYRMANYGELKNVVLSIKPLDEKYYDIHSMYYWGHFTQYPYVLASTHVLAFREDGRFVLGNWLEYYSRDWKTVTKGDITFHYQDYRRDNKKIRKAVEFLDFMKREYDVDVEHLDVYISKGWSETQKLKGYSFDPSDTAVSDTRDLGGTTDWDNNIIYSNSTKGEFYQHEMMRFIALRYPDAHRLLMDGLSEYHSDESAMRGVPHKEHFKNLNDFLTAHPEIDLKVFDNFDSGNSTEKNYLIGMLLVKMIEDGCGHAKLIEALETVNTDEDLILFLERELGVKENEINGILRTLVNRCSSEGFETK